MIITIARQCGCGAKDVGRILAAHYHLPMYTRQNLLDMARRDGMLDEMDAFFHECPVDDLTDAITSFTCEHTKVRQRFDHCFNTMLGSTDCILIGRCGNHIFQSRRDLVSVFLHGDKEQRVRNIMSDKGFSHGRAEEYVSHIDDERIAYHRYYTGLTWGNAEDYDLSLDCCRLGAENTARIIETYVKTVKG